MSCTNTPLHNELLGAVIGLARTCANNPKTDDTDRLIFTALRVSANKSANEQTLAAMIRRINEEKAIISPGCATCTARCGNTDNYDMSLLWKRKIGMLSRCKILLRISPHFDILPRLKPWAFPPDFCKNIAALLWKKTIKKYHRL